MALVSRRPPPLLVLAYESRACDGPWGDAKGEGEWDVDRVCGWRLAYGDGRRSRYIPGDGSGD